MRCSQTYRGTAGWTALAAVAASAVVALPAGQGLAEGSRSFPGGATTWRPLHAELPAQLTSHRDLRYEGVVGQTDWHTCGPATVSTLLTYYLLIEAGESACLEIATRAAAQRGRALGDPLTALDLAHTLEALGVHAQGYRVTIDSLVDYFRRGGPPVIAHVTRPQDHFLLIAGLVRGHFVLDDPSWGTRIEPCSSLERQRGFSGVVLVPLLEGGLAAAAHRRQAAVRDYASLRLARLHRLREELP